MAQDFNAIYPTLVEAMGAADVDLAGLTWAVQALDPGAVFGRDDDFLDALSVNLMGDPVELTGIAWAKDDVGVGLSTDMVNLATAGIFTSLAEDAEVGALIVFIDSGSAATSRLAAWIGVRYDTSPVAETVGPDAPPFWWPTDGVFIRFPC